MILLIMYNRFIVFNNIFIRTKQLFIEYYNLMACKNKKKKINFQGDGDFYWTPRKFNDISVQGNLDDKKSWALFDSTFDREKLKLERT